MKTIRFSQSADTLCAHAGQGRDDGAPLVAPLVQSTTFCRDRVDSTAPHAYSRVSNPTVAALESVLGALEQAPPAVAFASGLAAETALFLALLRAGDHVVCGRAVYGGTTRLLQQLLTPLGIATTFVDTPRAESLRPALRRETRLVFVETPANPTLELTDIAAVARIARAAGVPLAVDNTFLTPVLQQPLELGADVALYSTTKFIEGHSLALGGAIVSRDEQLLERLRWVRKCTGGIQTPFHAWLTLHGIKTLPLRIERQSQTAQRIAGWLKTQAGVARVCYPALSDADAALARRQHRGGHGAVVSLALGSGAPAVERFLAALRGFQLVEHVGSVESLITHPATMTHADVPAEQRSAVGITDGLLRLSIGLEDPDELIAALDEALAVARAAPQPEEEQACTLSA